MLPASLCPYSAFPLHVGRDALCGCVASLQGDVQLPPWAASADDFIEKNREALESEYVISVMRSLFAVPSL
jgi:hypothetical protein